MISEILFMALGSLKVNKMRTFLSMLGIIIGVAAVIAIVSVGTGAQNYITSEISELGSNLINISQDLDFEQALLANNSAAIFTVDLAESINKFSPSVKEVLPNLQAGGNLSYGTNNINTSLIGTSAVYQEITKFYPQIGRFINQADINSHNDIIVLGVDLADQLFPNQNPIDQMVKFNYQGRIYLFRVMGIMERKSTGILGNYNNQAYIPSSTFMAKLSHSNSVNGYLAQAVSSENALLAVSEIQHFLNRHLGDSDQFSIFSQEQIIDIINRVADTLNLMLGGIAGISLLVGGIGIMNIMLVSVTERTKEIGIRKALGAKEGQIRQQFIFEALFISGIGGIIGIALGWLGAAGIAEIGEWDLVFTLSSVIIAFGFALLLGLFFGIYPAFKAAKLDPVEALSHE